MLDARQRLRLGAQREEGLALEIEQVLFADQRRPGERDDFRAAIDVAAARYPGLPVWAAGYSFGAWIAADVGAVDPRVRQLIAIAPPVTSYDFEAVIAAGKPVFLIQGERDHLAPVKSVQRFYGTLTEPRELVIVDGADHLFDGHVSEVADTIADLLSE